MIRYISLVLAVSSLVKPVLPVLDYIFNYDYIATELCINRDKPELNCNGKCYLMQSLAEQAEREKEKENKSLERRYELPVFYVVRYDLQMTVCLSPKNKMIVNLPYFNFYSFLFFKDMVRPPIG